MVYRFCVVVTKDNKSYPYVFTEREIAVSFFESVCDHVFSSKAPMRVIMLDMMTGENLREESNRF